MPSALSETTNGARPPNLPLESHAGSGWSKQHQSRIQRLAGFIRAFQTGWDSLLPWRAPSSCLCRLDQTFPIGAALGFSSSLSSHQLRRMTTAMVPRSGRSCFHPHGTSLSPFDTNTGASRPRSGTCSFAFRPVACPPVCSILSCPASALSIALHRRSHHRPIALVRSLAWLKVIPGLQLYAARVYVTHPAPASLKAGMSSQRQLQTLASLFQVRSSGGGHVRNRSFAC